MPHLLRPGLLDGVTILVAPEAARTHASACAVAGARIEPLDVTAETAPPCDALLVDAAALAGPALDATGLRRALDATWPPVRAVANVWIEAQRAGRVLLVAPRPAAGPHAEALRAGLENLARTTSIEWSRFQITTVAVLPGPQTTDEELAELVAYVISPAGDYYSGCALTLG